VHSIPLAKVWNRCHFVRHVQACPTNPVWPDLTKLHSARQNVPILYNGWPFPPKLPLPMGDMDPHVRHDSLDPSEPTDQTDLYRFSRLSTDDRRMSLYFTMGRPFSPKNLRLSMGGSERHLIHGPLGPPKSSTQTASRSIQPFLQGSLVWQDRLTDRPRYSVSNNRPHLRTEYCDAV